MILIKDENSKKARIVDMLIGDTFRWEGSNYVLVDSNDWFFKDGFNNSYIAYNINHWLLEEIPADAVVEETHYKMEEV